jgi:hypothetical protein
MPSNAAQPRWIAQQERLGDRSDIQQVMQDGFVAGRQ